MFCRTLLREAFEYREIHAVDVRCDIDDNEDKRSHSRAECRHPPTLGG